MTNTEAILILIKMIPQPLRGDGKSTTHVMMTEALTMAIQALNQESTLDKIRAEIESQRKEVIKKYTEDDELQAFYDGLNDGLKDARDIIDKYIDKYKKKRE